MKNTPEPDTSMQKVMDLKKKVESFEQLLGSIESLGDKKKNLWKEIYENAITDRINAYTLFTELHVIVRADATQHAIQGPQLAKYLERMGKCTDQLLHLVELIADAENASEKVDANEIFGHAKALR